MKRLKINNIAMHMTCASLMAVTTGYAYAGNVHFHGDRPHKKDVLLLTFDQGPLAKAMDALVNHWPKDQGKVLKRLRNGKTLELHFPELGGDLGKLLAKAQALAAMMGGVSLQPNYAISLDQTFPNDTLFNQTWGLHNQGAPSGKMDADIDAPEAWEYSTGSKSVIVGIVDTGVDYQHKDLAANIWMNPGEVGTDSKGRDKRSNGVDDDGNGYIDDVRGWDFVNDDNDPMDDHGHGTHVAGIVGARGNNSTGISGVNWEVSLMPLKIMPVKGYGWESDVVDALAYATKMGVSVTNNSWGVEGSSVLLRNAIAEAGRNGVLFVNSAGNNGRNIDTKPYYPASFNLPNQITVGGTDRSDQNYQYTNYGKSTVHLAAPAVQIESTYPNQRYVFMSGTSMATPYVTGSVALLKAIDKKLSMNQLKDLILQSVDKIASQKGMNLTEGRLNVGKAAMRAYSGQASDPEPVEVPQEVKNLVLKQDHGNEVALGFSLDGTYDAIEFRLLKSAYVSQSQWESGVKVISTIHETAKGQFEAMLSDLSDRSLDTYIIARAKIEDQWGPVSYGLKLSKIDLPEETPPQDAPTGALTVGASFGMLDGRSMQVTEVVGKWWLNQGQLANNGYAALDKGYVIGKVSGLPQGRYTLHVTLSYDFEELFDYGFIDVSFNDGASYTNVAKWTGTSQGFVQASLSLDAAMAKAQTLSGNLQWRIRVKADDRNQKVGFIIKSFAVTHQAP